MALVLFVTVPMVLMALVLSMCAPALMLFGRLLGTFHLATIASWLGIGTFLAATA